MKMDIIDIQNDVVNTIKDLVNVQISIDTNLQDINMDSITFIKMIVNLETTFNFEFDDEMLLITKFPTVKTIIEYVAMKV
jgi:acyl carrier protein